MDKDKQTIIDEIVKMLQLKGVDLENEDIDLYQKAMKLDVLIDTMKFLQNYDENTKVLNQYWLNKKRQEKFNGDR